MSEHDVPSLAQRSQRYENDVGLFDQPPVDAVSVEPSFVVPLIVGLLVFAGGAAAATAAKMAPTAITAAKTGMPRSSRRAGLPKIFTMSFPPRTLELPPLAIPRRPKFRGVEAEIYGSLTSPAPRPVEPIR